MKTETFETRLEETGASRFYLCIGNNAWGCGLSREEAIGNAKKNVPWSLLRRGKREIEMAMWLVDKETEVTGMGALRYPKERPPVELERARIKVPKNFTR